MGINEKRLVRCVSTKLPEVVVKVVVVDAWYFGIWYLIIVFYWKRKKERRMKMGIQKNVKTWWI